MLPLTFRLYELQRSLIAQKILMIHEPSGKTIQKFQFTAQIETQQENTLFWPTTPYCRLCNYTRISKYANAATKFKTYQVLYFAKIVRSVALQVRKYACSRRGVFNWLAWCSINMLLPPEVNSKIALTLDEGGCKISKRPQNWTAELHFPFSTTWAYIHFGSLINEKRQTHSSI